MSKAKWNIELGYKMYLDGKSDLEIAEAVGVSAGAVGWYRRNRWQLMPSSASTEKKNDKKPGVEFGTIKPAKEPKRGRKRTAKANAEADTIPTVLAAEAQGIQLPPQTIPSAGLHEEGNASFRTENDVKVMDAIATAVEGLSGIDAVCTADAILCLWQWSDRKHLWAAKKSIEYLLQRIDSKNEVKE